MNQTDLKALLEKLKSGDATVEQTLGKLASLPFTDLEFARVDNHRALRTGAAEVVYGASKSPEHIARIANTILETGQNLLVTRADQDAFDAVAAEHPDASYDARARLIRVDRHPVDVLGTVGVLSAGTSDLHVAAEAAGCAQFMGAEVTSITDIGVAGLHRLLSELERIRRDFDVIIVVAGMDGALPSVVTGLVEQPVIACPTSVGYGASFQGVSALLAALNACASGLTVVNIDNGFGAAAAAARILRAKCSA